VGTGAKIGAASPPLFLPPIPGKPCLSDPARAGEESIYTTPLYTRLTFVIPHPHVREENLFVLCE
jgi:hypothetical protein